jgi:hypothetical protein
MKLNNIEPEYSKQAPSNQTIIDIFKGSWYSSLPSEYNTVEEPGQTRSFDFAIDGRPKWVADNIQSGLYGLSILELGPFEGYNSYQLERLGAKEVVAVESNNINFIKCLMVKEITGIKAKYLYGDLVEYLDSCGRRFDIVYASGVLYHMEEPLRMLSLVADLTNTVYLWTQYYDENLIKDSHISSFFTGGKKMRVSANGYECDIHLRHYNQIKDSLFSGGIQPYSYWMKKHDIIGYLRHVGFKNITIQLDQPDYFNGPVISFMAQR